MRKTRPFVLGLTGSVGMGKSTTAKMFRELGVPVWDADATVHKLYAIGGAAVGPIGGRFPAAISKGTVDRAALRDMISKDSTTLAEIEAIVHPLVSADRAAFLHSADGDLVVVEVPLLFETGAQDICDAVLVVTAPEEVQRQRVMSRPGITADHFDMIRSKQMSDSEKRSRADYVIETMSMQGAQSAVEDLIAQIRSAGT